MTNPNTTAPTRHVADLGAEVGIAYLEQSLYTKLHRRRQEGAKLPGIAEIRADLRGARGPIPARVSQRKAGQGDYLRIYIGGRYALVLNVTNNGRGYLIGDIHPLSLRDQDDIVRAGFALAAESWQLYDHPGDLPQRLDARWPEVREAWRDRPKIDGNGGRQELPARYQDYLDDLQKIVEKAREIELADTLSDRICRYQRITPAAVRRRTAQSVYKFQLMGESRLIAGAKVRIEEHSDLRGTVSEIRESLITVRFDQPVDFNRIPQLGAFLLSDDTTTLNKQAEAIETLREQRERNSRLLDALVGHDFLPLRPAPATPREPLDASQLAAFQMVLAVPDLALVQGPPGTGKTRTIKQIVRECAAGTSGTRTILISAYTNRAVDNVLKGLPETITAIRVGSSVTPDCAHLTLEAQAVRLQRRILDRTEPVLDRYATADSDGGAAVQRLRELATARARLAESGNHMRQAAAELDRNDAEITAPLRSRLDDLAAQLAGCQAAVAEADRLAAATAARQASAAKTAAMPVLGGLFRGRADRLAAHAASAAAAVAQVAGELEATSRALTSTQAKLAGLRATDPHLAELRERLRAADGIHRDNSERTVAAAQRLATSLGETSALPPISADPSTLARFHDAAAQAVALAQSRLRLLRQWRATLERRTEQLYPELIRYADVVGATCIGVATSKYLADISFDLVIIDEAGQISTPSLLVPLVRARRAVLVGDHVQLPPYAERELTDWARRQEPALADLVTKSAFELLFPYVPEGSRQVLSFQRRMPRAVADFISAQFYGGLLQTAVKRPGRDELFVSTMAFIDTAVLPASQRHERHPRPGEPWNPDSYVNDAEARIITDLVTYYDARQSDWVVIVPFLGQVGRVTTLLAERLGDEERVASRVASVDSFQGGEHDTVIYGFTRSNAMGAVGFFKDVRRSNVAFSRARQRLIMVGDMSTLRNASDPGFRMMVEALHDHLKLRGDIRDYREMMALLAAKVGR